MAEVGHDMRREPAVISVQRSESARRIGIGGLYADDGSDGRPDDVSTLVRSLAGGRTLAGTATRIRRKPTREPPATAPIAVTAAPEPIIRRDWRLAKVKDWHQELNQTGLGKKYKGETSLHHHVSQMTMSDVASSYDEAIDSGGPLKAAAGRFKSAVWQSLAQSGIAAPERVAKALHNLPFNLHYGPTRAIGNPGSAFDPTTEPGKKAGTRQDSAMTTLLRGFETTYRAAAEANLALDVATWDKLSGVIKEAQEQWSAGGKELETSEEQWMLVDEDDNTWTKKGLLGLKEYADCFNAFNKQDTYLGPERGGAKGATVAHYVRTLEFDDGSEIDLVMYFDAERLDHFCNRHTYKYFDFGGIKAINVFWPADTDRQSLSDIVSAKLKKIAKAIATDAQFDKAEEDVGAFELRLGSTLGGSGFKATSADGTAYFAANEVGARPNGVGARADAPEDVIEHFISIEMFAPTGPSFAAYEGRILAEMAKDVDRNSER